MRGSRRRHLEPTARAGGALEPSSLLHGRLGGLRRADPAGAAPRRQGPDARDRARPFPPAALAGAVPSPHLRGVQGRAHGGRLDRALRPLRRRRRDRRTPIYASLRPCSISAPRPSARSLPSTNLIKSRSPPRWKLAEVTTRWLSSSSAALNTRVFWMSFD